MAPNLDSYVRIKTPVVLDLPRPSMSQGKHGRGIELGSGMGMVVLV